VGRHELREEANYDWPPEEEHLSGDIAGAWPGPTSRHAERSPWLTPTSDPWPTGILPQAS
jgi:hypothetical protein